MQWFLKVRELLDDVCVKGKERERLDGESKRERRTYEGRWRGGYNTVK